LDRQWQRQWQRLQAKLGTGEVDLTEDKRVFAPLPIPWSRVAGVTAASAQNTWDRPYAMPALMLACVGPCLGALSLPADAPPAWRDASLGVMMAHITQLCIVREVSARMHGHVPGGDELVPVNAFLHSTAGFAPMHSATAFMMMCGAPLGGFSSPISASVQLLLQYAWQCVQPVDAASGLGGAAQLRTTSGSSSYRGIVEACSSIAAAVADTFRTIAPASHASIRVSSAGATGGEYRRVADQFSWDIERRKMSAEASVAAIQAVACGSGGPSATEAYYFGKYTYEYALMPVAAVASRAADLARRTIVSAGTRGGSGAGGSGTDAAAAPPSPTISAPIMTTAHVPPAPLAAAATVEAAGPPDSAASAAVSLSGSSVTTQLVVADSSGRPLRWLTSRVADRVAAAGATILGALASAPPAAPPLASGNTADGAAGSAAGQPTADAATSSAPLQAAVLDRIAAEADCAHILESAGAVMAATPPNASAGMQITSSSCAEVHTGMVDSLTDTPVAAALDVAACMQDSSAAALATAGESLASSM